MITYTLAVHSDTGAAQQLSSVDDYETLFTMSDAVIRDVSDAKRVWTAFREVYHVGWNSDVATHVSPTEWELGRLSFEQTNLH